MPFRHLPRRAARWVLPCFVAVSVFAIGVWCGWAVQVVGGPHRLTAVQAVIVTGLAGIAALAVFTGVAVVAVLESSNYETRIAVLSLVARQRLEAVRRLRADLAGVLPEESEEESDGSRTSARPGD